MSRFEKARREMGSLDELASRNQWVCRLHPLSKLLVTVGYTAVVMSFDKYDLSGVAAMAVYPVLTFSFGELSVFHALKRLKIIMLPVLAVGAFNPFFDRGKAALAGLVVPAGLISMLTLMLKGTLAVLAAYLLIGTTSIEEICRALRILRLPSILVNQVLFTYRYAGVLISEVGRVTDAYSLRAPRQKGVHFRHWGSLVGQVLLKSRDRAETVYQSMILRGYEAGGRHTGQRGSAPPEVRRAAPGRSSAGAVLYCLCWGGVFFVLRAFPVFRLVGGLLS